MDSMAGGRLTLLAKVSLYLALPERVIILSSLQYDKVTELGKLYKSNPIQIMKLPFISEVMGVYGFAARLRLYGELETQVQYICRQEFNIILATVM